MYSKTQSSEVNY